MTNGEIGKLKGLGHEWQKDGYHRIYFDNVIELYGLKTTHYNTGNISSACLRGEKISNTQALKIRDRFVFADAKVWFDIVDGKFRGKNIGQDDFNDIVAEIRNRIKEAN